MQTLSAYMSITELSGIAVWWAPVKEPQYGPLIEMLASKAQELPLHDLDLETAPRISPRLPVFQRPRIIPVRKMLWSLAALAVVAGLTWAGLAVRKALEPPPPPPPARMEVVVPAASFFTACASTLAGWWPKGTGWMERSSGCIMDTERLPDGVTLPDVPSPAWRQMVVWREYVPSKAVNRVLLEAVTSDMTDAWPNSVVTDTDRLLLWTATGFPLA